MLKILLRSLIISLFITMLGVIIWFVKCESKYFPIEKIKVRGNFRYTTQSDIESTVKSMIKYGFYLTNVNRIKQGLEKLTWIDSAIVTKEWPSVLNISIIEKVPLARIRGERVVTTNGSIIITNIFAEDNNLPLFNLEDISDLKELTRAYFVILHGVDLIGRQIVELALLPEIGLQAILDNGAKIIFGKKELEVRVQRLVVSYENKLKLMQDKIAYIDLRYINGVAVGML